MAAIRGVRFHRVPAWSQREQSLINSSPPGQYREKVKFILACQIEDWRLGLFPDAVYDPKTGKLGPWDFRDAFSR